MRKRCEACQDEWWHRGRDGVTGLPGLVLPSILQAVTTWKDLGSAAAAAEYIRNLNQGVVNISFSTAGLCVLPDLGRLPFLESVAACFNTFVDPASITNLSTLPPYLKVSTVRRQVCIFTDIKIFSLFY